MTRQSSCGIDYEIQSRRLDIVFQHKEGNQCFIVDIAVSGDARIAKKDKERLKSTKISGEKLQDCGTPKLVLCLW